MRWATVLLCVAGVLEVGPVPFWAQDPVPPWEDGFIRSFVHSYVFSVSLLLSLPFARPLLSPFLFPAYHQSHFLVSFLFLRRGL